ncbi:MAG: hypothetical protein RLN96_08010, partial [Pseudomonadales bacterium]
MSISLLAISICVFPVSANADPITYSYLFGHNDRPADTFGRASLTYDSSELDNAYLNPYCELYPEVLVASRKNALASVVDINPGSFSDPLSRVSQIKSGLFIANICE